MIGSAESGELTVTELKTEVFSLSTITALYNASKFFDFTFWIVPKNAH